MIESQGIKLLAHICISFSAASHTESPVLDFPSTSKQTDKWKIIENKNVQV